MDISYDKYMIKSNEWNLWNDNIAKFGNRYDFRALVALKGLGANPVKMAVYPFCTVDETGVELCGENEYVVRFESYHRFMIEENGFWSVTMYGEEDFLISNPIGRYCINDRSEIKRDEGGGFNIYISAKEPSPWKKHNWLPCGKGKFHLVLRAYIPDPNMRNGLVALPRVHKCSLMDYIDP